MKILLLTLEYPPIVGGVSNYLHGLYDGLAGAEVRVLAPPSTKFYVNWFWPRWLPFYWHVKKMCREEQFDAVHVSHVLPLGTVGRWLLESLGVPFVLYVHGTDLLTAKMSGRRWRVAAANVAAAKVVIANSEATARLVRELGLAPQRLEIVKPAVAAAAEHVAPKKIASLRAKFALAGRVILFAGRLVERKGLLVALAAMEKMAASNDFLDVILVVVGEGSEKDAALKFAREHNLLNRVRFVGAVGRAELAAWYATADLFWFPAQEVRGEFEGFGMTSLEAQQYGCPVVVSRRGGLPETLRDGATGAVVAGDAASFAVATGELLRAPEKLAQMRVVARSWAEPQTWAARQTDLRRILGF